MMQKEIDKKDYFKETLQWLEQQERSLEGSMKDLEDDLSGLLDIDLTCELINHKFKTALYIIEENSQKKTPREGLFKAAKEKALAAMTLLENLKKTNLSLDQIHILKGAEGYRKIKESLRKLILAGGGGLFEPEKLENLKGLGDIIYNAVKKYVKPDDRYEALFKIEKLPPFLRKLVNLFFPIIGGENKAPPPYGIEEGEEVVYFSRRMTMPLAQAIFFLENEALPGLNKKIADNPDDRDLQKKREFAREKLKELKNIHFVPRAMPLIIEKGFYTEAFTRFSPSGEPLITLPLPVYFPSGTNLDRAMNLIKGEIVKKAAGKGISDKLDKQYAYLKSIDSGPVGNCRQPGARLDTEVLFTELKNELPFLRHVDNKKDLNLLMNAICYMDKDEALEHIRNCLFHDEKGEALFLKETDDE